MFRLSIVVLIALLFSPSIRAESKYTTEQLSKWLDRFPQADANRDGVLTSEEADQYRKSVLKGSKAKGKTGGGAPRTFSVDPRWENSDFPETAVFRKSPEEIASIYQEVVGAGKKAVVSYEKPENGVLRIIGTGHSFMAPGYNSLLRICRADGFEQPLYTHIGGGMTGSTRYKWEQENGIFQFEGKPVPKLLASIANADWDVMTWGPYFNDEIEYYTCWIDFCLKYQPNMKFYLSDAWIQLYQLEENPESEEFFTEEVIEKLGQEKRDLYGDLMKKVREMYPDKVFILPTSDAMTLAAKYYVRGELPQVEGIHKVIGGKERSLWRDQLGHLGPGFDRLEGYVFYATLYGRSPELIDKEVDFGGNGDYPGPDLDKMFRKIAWEAVTGHPLSGVVDEDGDGMADVESE